MSRPKGMKLTEEHKKKIGSSNKGKTRSEAFREMRRKITLGRKQTPEHVAKRIAKQKGKKRTIEQRIRISQGHKRKEIYKTPLRNRIYHSIEYKLWRESVFKRDNYQCIWGGKEHGSKLQADHIKPFAFFPELRFAIDNGRTLCVLCHRTTDTWGQKATTKYKGMESYY